MEESMTKNQLDELYHLLRVAANDAASPHQSINLDTGLSPSEEGHRIFGLAKHLLSTPDYEALVQYCALYGSRYLLPQASAYIKRTSRDRKRSYSRVVELGAGLSWLGRGLALSLSRTKSPDDLSSVTTLLVDKRPWPFIDEVLDLETQQGMIKLGKLLLPDDLIVMVDFLHCVDYPEELVKELLGYDMLILEYSPDNADYLKSYDTQLGRYGATPFSPIWLEDHIGRRSEGVVSLPPYKMYFIDRSCKEE
jgi:hypothetical protein